MLNLRICITFSVNALTPKFSGLIFWTDFHFSAENVLVGILSKQCPLFNILNYFIVIGKLFLWDCRRSQTLPKIHGLESKLKIKYEMENNINNKTFFEEKWVLTPM